MSIHGSDNHSDMLHHGKLTHSTIATCSSYTSVIHLFFAILFLFLFLFPRLTLAFVNNSLIFSSQEFFLLARLHSFPSDADAQLHVPLILYCIALLCIISMQVDRMYIYPYHMLVDVSYTY